MTDSPILAIEFVLEVVLWGALWWIASWVVVNRRVSLRELLPGSVLAGLGFAVAGMVGRVVLPPLLADSANRYGVLGMAFTYIGWLLVLACVLLVAATSGRVVIPHVHRASVAPIGFGAHRRAPCQRRTLGPPPGSERQVVDPFGGCDRQHLVQLDPAALEGQP